MSRTLKFLQTIFPGYVVLQLNALIQHILLFVSHKTIREHNLFYILTIKCTEAVNLLTCTIFIIQLIVNTMALSCRLRTLFYLHVVCILPLVCSLQSAFYPWSAVCSMHFIPGLQSAVCIYPWSSAFYPWSSAFYPWSSAFYSWAGLFKGRLS